MFKYYNKNWENYYGTDKYFIMSENWTLKDYIHK
jgi:hypothetical protein